MPRNVEIKARVADPPALLARVEGIADRGPERIDQDDTFFAAARGRLKLRDFGDGRGELIAYARPDASGPTTSAYRIAPTDDAARLRDTLAQALEPVGRVVKRRTLYLVGRTRIHLDRVDGLGDFVELEVVLDDGEPATVGEAEAQALLRRLGIAADALVAEAYVDLLGGVPIIGR